MTGFFEEIFVSESIGYNKPDIAFFEYCLSKMDCLPQECIVVGDSLISDIQGGKNAHMQTCWYNPEKKNNNLKIVGNQSF